MITVTKKEINLTSDEVQQIIMKQLNIAEDSKPVFTYQYDRDNYLQQISIEFATSTEVDDLPA